MATWNIPQLLNVVVYSDFHHISRVVIYLGHSDSEALREVGTLKDLCVHMHVGVCLHFQFEYLHQF